MTRDAHTKSREALLLFVVAIIASPEVLLVMARRITILYTRHRDFFGCNDRQGVKLVALGARPDVCPIVRYIHVRVDLFTVIGDVSGS